jgi:cytochrome c oxidase subunit 2
MRLISDLFWIMLGISAVIFIVVTGALLYSAANFRAAADSAPPRQIYGSRPIEITWTAIPFLILIVAFVFTAKYIHDINSPPSAGKQLDVIARGHQWWWEFYYPSLNLTTANEVHVPTNVPLHFHVESYDVIHSFWVPQLQRQIDANPGQDNAVFVEMNRPGVYGGACYEYCGDAHAWMKFRMVVQTKGQFNIWANHMRASAAPPTTAAESRGRKIFLSNTCIECHAINYPGSTASGVVAPNLTHLASRWTIGAGAAPLTLSDTMAWIQKPSHYKPGVLMPGYPLLSNKDLRDLATYLTSLK